LGQSDNVQASLYVYVNEHKALGHLRMIIVNLFAALFLPQVGSNLL